jgi:uncharacterized integral membrane protein
MTFTMPSGFVTDMLANVTATLSQLSPYITVILGVVVVGLLIEIIIGAIRK